MLKILENMSQVCTMRASATHTPDPPIKVLRNPTKIIFEQAMPMETFRESMLTG